ncbi:MAG: M48 family metallopeptidase [Bacteroidetes bacterium]|nr:M48 family metallopeptidase [Bacteroidota bacterium]
MKNIYIDGVNPTKYNVNVVLNEKEIVIDGISQKKVWDITKVHKKIEKSVEGYEFRYGDLPYEILCIRELKQVQEIQKKYPYSGFFLEKKGITYTKFLIFIILFVLLTIFGLFAGYYWGLDWAAKKVAAKITIEKEHELGEEFYKQYISSVQVNSEQTVLVDSFFKLLKYETAYPMKITVVNSDVVNAFAMPGGYIIVNSGILKTVEKPEELAGLLGHELSHINQKHGTQSMIRSLGSTIILSMFFGDYEQTSILVSQLENLKSLKYGRDMEAEADEKGFEQMSKHCGYSPQGMIGLFEKLKKESSVAPPEFLSTHPDLDNRIKATVDKIKTYQPNYIETAVPDSIFNQIKNK